MRAHIRELCAEHGIELVGASRRGRAIRIRGGRRQVSIPPIKGQVSYMIALHEIGHLVGPGRSAPRLEAEANAWRWALDHSEVELTPTTLRSVGRRLESYLHWAQRCQHRQRPPRIPEDDHQFWQLVRYAES